ncbi:MAG: Sporulation protein YunB [Pelotomaculum sp. PtaB.Bin013]|uniref:Sporulation protein YunB n=1 Tax=Pelotomaculum isophthalicicum JI TaxID=947010 RepID=A0A9X4H3D0_9FIRM|nr:sporulation protein YunB [Pelotomaculum isophthalicicum]MDF9409576.1 sporulation protein YunB [Pelotomaculum isophthalicicum JI]OPX81022.1 MAG: Sporulation protein YunB [Pelotomaculum sp. PtaB.Bin013]
MFKRRRPYKKAFIIMVVSISLMGILMLLDIKLRDVFFNVAEVKAVQLVTEAIQESLHEEATSENIRYQDLIYIHKDNEGRITLMQADTLRVNRIASNTSMAAQKALENLRWQSFSIPIGQVFGFPIFANSGPRLRYSIMQVGSVKFNITDKFESAGINQTKHTIYLNLDTNVRIVVPSKSGEAVISTQMPLTENIIVGSIPDTFVTLPGGILGNVSGK